MRRKDREITDFNEIIDVLRRSDTIRLGLHNEPCPYVVPLSFGFEVSANEILIYFHGAKEGLKHDLIAKDPHVCVEADIFHRYAETPQNSITTEYESFIGFGTAALVSGEEAARGMDLMLEHCGYKGFEYDRKALDFTAIYRITLTSFTGKKRFL